MRASERRETLVDADVTQLCLPTCVCVWRYNLRICFACLVKVKELVDAQISCKSAMSFYAVTLVELIRSVCRMKERHQWRASAQTILY
jgi:hypothetical protein